MKKIILPVVALCISAFSFAQRYESTKTFLMLNQGAKAEEDLVKNMTNKKFYAKPEAHILSASVYTMRIQDSALSPDKKAEYIAKANDAYVKYLAADASKALLKDPIYRTVPINLYTAYYQGGYAAYEKQQWKTAMENFQNAIPYSDYLLVEKMLPGSMDTTLMLLNAYTAEKLENQETAEKYYTILADKNVTGDGYESIYRFLVKRNFELKKYDDFDKYRALGKKMYPESDYFSYDKTDFAVGLAQGFYEQIKALELVIAKDPTNYKANLSLGQIIFDTIHHRNENVVKLQDEKAMAQKMVEAFDRAKDANPDDEIAYIYVGNHYINKSIDVNDARTKFNREMKTKYKPGAAFSAADKAQKEKYDADYAMYLNQAKPYYLKAAEIFGKKPKLENVQTRQYKNVSGYLADIANLNKELSKSKADIAKYEAEATKWDNVYSSLK